MTHLQQGAGILKSSLDELQRAPLGKVSLATVKAVPSKTVFLRACSGLGGLPEHTDATFLCENKDRAPLAHDPDIDILV